MPTTKDASLKAERFTNRQSELTCIIDDNSYNTPETMSTDNFEEDDSSSSSCSSFDNEDNSNNNNNNNKCLSEIDYAEKKFHNHNHKQNRLLQMIQTDTDLEPEDETDVDEEDILSAALSASLAAAAVIVEPLSPPRPTPAQELEDATLVTSVATATATSTCTPVNDANDEKEKRVTFGFLEIHEHLVEMGGSGVPRCGPSITLSWKEQSCLRIESVEEYEDARPCVPRRGAEMLQPKMQRVDMLLETGYTFRQINECSHEIDAIRKQRCRTVQRVAFRCKTTSMLKKALKPGSWKR